MSRTRAGLGILPLIASAFALAAALALAGWASGDIALSIGWLRLLGQPQGWPRTEIGVALLVLAAVLLVGCGAWAAASALGRAGAERRRGLAALAGRERQYRVLFDASPTFICTHAAAGVLVAVNPAAAAALGYPRHELPGRRFTDYMSAESAARFNDHLPALQARKRQEITLEVIRRDGQRRTWLYLEQWIEEPGAAPFALGHALDVTERWEARDKLARQAFHDRLTGIGNRALFDDGLARAVDQAKRSSRCLAVLYLDLDGFKLINDRFGHEAGDHLLREIAGRLVRNCRQGDLVARLGGDEFALVLSDIDATAARRRGESLLRLVAQPVVHNSHVLLVSGSLGISLYPECGDTQRELLHAADRALYRSKACGHGQLQLSSAPACPPPAAAGETAAPAAWPPPVRRQPPEAGSPRAALRRSSSRQISILRPVGEADGGAGSPSGADSAARAGADSAARAGADSTTAK